MTSSKDRQVSICLRKFNLEEIEDTFKSNLLALPDLEEENRKQFLETLAALQEARAINAEIKSFKQENGRLTAKRGHLQRECNDIISMSEKMLEKCIDLEQLKRQEECDSLRITCEYEAKLQEVLQRYRQSGNIYDEETVRRESEKANEILSDVVAEEKIRQNENIELRNTLDNMEADVPENILEIMGQAELVEKLNSLTNQLENM